MLTFPISSAIVTLGPPLGPLIMGFVAERVGWEWVYWIFAITSGVEFILYAIFSPETRYISQPGSSSSSSSDDKKEISIKKQYFSFSRIDSTPMTVAEFIRPFKMLKYMTILIPIYAHTMIFNLSAAMLTVEIPQLFAIRFGFNAQQIGLQFIGIVVGTIVGEAFNAVVLSWLRRRAQQGVGNIKKAARPTEYLFSSYLGFCCMIAGLVIFCILLGNTKPKDYNVGPIIGIGIAAFGNQIVTSFLINCESVPSISRSEMSIQSGENKQKDNSNANNGDADIIQMHTEHAAPISVVLGLIRQTWCFIGPFWFPSMFQTLGFKGSAGLLVGLVVVSVLPLIWMHFMYGRR